MNRKKLKFIAGSAVILAAVVALAISSLEESKSYYQTVPELKAMGARAEGRRVRVAGNVVPGSIVRREEGVVTFDIDYEGEVLPVRYVGRGPLPDTLVDRAQAVAEGTLLKDGNFEATLVQAKCASKYEAAYKEGKTTTE
ncbi:MAG: cytochrome c maturation protein CcmE [Vicinamibacteria bacterium]